MPTQLVVSRDTGALEALFVWEENNPFTAVVAAEENGTWHAHLVPKEETDPFGAWDEMDENTPLVPDYTLVGFFPTLHAALEGLQAHPQAPSQNIATGAPYGEIVVG